MAKQFQSTQTKKTQPRGDSQLVLGKEFAELSHRVFIEGWRGAFLAFAGVVLVILIGLFDYSTGPELSFSIIYLFPIALTAWWGGLSQGLLTSMVCAISWQMVEVAEGAQMSSVIQLWNGTTRFGVFVLTSSLLARLRVSLYLEKKLARSDPLTGAANGRTFYESVSQAVERSLRGDGPLTLVYLDMDNFKWLNDTLGHAAGDEALCDLVGTIDGNIRSTDHFARLGGDEFALLFTNCGESDGNAILIRIQQRFATLMARKRWPVTLSIGAMTFPQPMRDVDRMVRLVDGLMYRAKKAGKDQIVHEMMDDQKLRLDATAPKFIERRATARVLCDRPARIRFEDAPAEADEFARVRDIFASGLCLHLERELSANTLIAVEPLHECGAKTLLVRVMSAATEDNGWLHECAFPNRLTTGELSLWEYEQSAESCHDRG
ncbi:MAG: diguanylate cyclase [Gemmataceae bacterium]|nr:diguanylate cyclase [Gemmataceae bacterium]